MKWSPEELFFGDIARVKIGSVYHYGIFCSEQEVIAFGYPPLRIREIKDSEVRVVSTDIETFPPGTLSSVRSWTPRRKSVRKRRKRSYRPQGHVSARADTACCTITASILSTSVCSVCGAPPRRMKPARAGTSVRFLRYSL